MVKLIITKVELEEILLWGKSYERMSENAKLPFEPDEKRLMEKLRKKHKQIWNPK